MKLADEIKENLKDFKFDTQAKSTGRVLEVKDGIVIADGLDSVGVGELVKFDNANVEGMVLNLEQDSVGIVVLDEYQAIKEGDSITALSKGLVVKVDENLLSRVIDPLGNVHDGKGAVKFGKDAKDMPLEKIAPGVIERKNVSRPLQTGIKAIDALIPIGRGQRQLIIGDRQTGKTAIALDTIINQKDENPKDKPMICIYVAIGQKRAKVAQITAKLEELGAMDYTIIVTADASMPASLQYIAPYTGCAIGEYFAEKGMDALVIYDDLTKHAWAYREISLLLKRPPGREAYPGDIFYLHSRLLERALQYSDEKGGGSLTSLPVIETLAGDVSAYIPTNVISITDGQIFLESDLFYSGQKPAINIGISVSRVGGDAQLKPMKQVAGPLKLDLAQYRELAAFAQFGSDLDPETQKKLDRGARVIEILKQNQYHPYNLAHQICILYAAVNGYLDKYAVKDLAKWEEGFLTYLDAMGKEVLKKLAAGTKIEDKFEEEIKKLIEGYTY